MHAKFKSKKLNRFNPENLPDWATDQAFLRARIASDVDEARNAPRLVQGSKSPTADITAPGTCIRVHHRQWNDRFRITVETDVPTVSPPQQGGDRVTTELSARGARALADSCEYVRITRGGYKTFLTLTFDASARSRIESGETTIQREVSRFFDALQKIRSRGYSIIDAAGKKTRISGDNESIAYCWVAENPWKLGDAGELHRNPHVHVLMDWSVTYDQFKGGWSSRIERVWKNGYAHLEKIKTPESAGYYMAKAAGYISKSAQGSDQGPITGNRYGMSACARAPGWVPIASYQIGGIGDTLLQARKLWLARVTPHREQRDQLKQQLSTVKKKSSHYRLLQKMIAQARTDEKTASRGAFFTDFGAEFQGLDSMRRFFKFAAMQGWQAVKKPVGIWLDKFRQKAVLTMGSIMRNYYIPPRDRGEQPEYSGWSEDEWSVSRENAIIYQQMQREPANSALIESYQLELAA